MRRSLHIGFATLCLSSAHATGQTRPTKSIDSAAVVLERMPCHGVCPVYRLSIQSNGVVTFEGLQFTEVASAHDSISPDKVAALVALIQKAGFDSLDSVYTIHSRGCGQYVYDLQTVILTLRTRGRAKRVTHDWGCMGGVGPGFDAAMRTIEELNSHAGGSDPPHTLARLEAAVDSVAQSGRWTKRP